MTRLFGQDMPRDIEISENLEWLLAAREAIWIASLDNLDQKVAEWVNINGGLILGKSVI
jgi:hypothetical protein